VRDELSVADWLTLWSLGPGTPPLTSLRPVVSFQRGDDGLSLARLFGGGTAMCLGIPGEVVELLDSNRHLAKVDVAGVRRNVNIDLLEDENVVPGDWVLIHVGFALAKIDEEEAQRALESLQLMGQAYDDEVQAVIESQIA